MLLPKIGDADGVQARTLHPLVVQVANHLGADLVLPGILERVAKTERSKLLWSEVCLGASRLDPGVDARARDETGFRAKSIVEVLGLDRRGRVWSGRLVRDAVAREDDAKGVAVHGGGRFRHWKATKQN